MKVLHITTNFPTDDHPAFGIFMKEQMLSLADKGIDCDVYFSNGKEKGKKEHLKSVRKVRRLIAQNQYDLVHCHHVLSAVILMFSGKMFKQKRIVSYQNDPKHEFGMFLFRIVYLLFNQIIIKNTSPLLNRKKMVYLPNGTNESFFKPKSRELCRQELGLQPDKVYLLFMDSNKGKRTQKRKDRFDDVIELLKNKHRIHNLETLELFNVKREMIPSYMCAADLHLLTSDFEGSPNSVKECLCCNVPVVSTPIGNVHDMMADIPGCYVSATFEAEELAEGVVKALAGKSFEGRKAFLEKGYSISSVADKLIQMYKALIY